MLWPIKQDKLGNRLMQWLTEYHDTVGQGSLRLYRSLPSRSAGLPASGSACRQHQQTPKGGLDAPPISLGWAVKSGVESQVPKAGEWPVLKLLFFRPLHRFTERQARVHAEPAKVALLSQHNKHFSLPLR